jgi:hypothetical protein
VSASAIPDAIAAILTRGYILPYCPMVSGSGSGRKQHRSLALQAGDVQSVSAHRAALLLLNNDNDNGTNATSCGATSCGSITTWNGTNRVYFRDGYVVTAETEAMILQDIMVAFQSSDLLKQVQTTDTNIQAVSFVTGSGATVAIVDMTTPETGNDVPSPSSLNETDETEAAATRKGMKPVGKAFLSIFILAIVAALLFVGYTVWKRHKAQEDAKGLSHVHLRTSNTMQNEDECVEEDSDGFVPFRPRKLRGPQSPAEFDTEVGPDERINDISIADSRDVASLPGNGAELKPSDTSFTSSKGQSTTTSRFTPDTLPTSSEVKPAVHHLQDNNNNSFSSYSDLQVPVTSPRNYSVPDTLDL